jgi:hypothetical protein
MSKEEALARALDAAIRELERRPATKVAPPEQEDPIADGDGAACWGGVWCGRHCKAINLGGNPCVRTIHPEPVHVWGTPPCNPNAAIREPLRLTEDN